MAAYDNFLGYFYKCVRHKNKADRSVKSRQWHAVNDDGDDNDDDNSKYHD